MRNLPQQPKKTSGPEVKKGISEEMKKQIKKHNEKVAAAFRRVKRGEVINLTDLMISKERVQEKMMQEEEEE